MFSFSLNTAPTFTLFTNTNALGQSIHWTGTSWYLEDVDGTKTVLEAPGSFTTQLSQVAPGPPAYGNSTSVQALNNHGVVVGSFLDPSGDIHGFVYFQGNYRIVDVPGAHKTWIQGVDDFGTIGGAYIDPSSGQENKFEATAQSFSLSDQTEGTNWADEGFVYQGPVAGLKDEYIIATHHNINVSATERDVFIHTSSGDDAINVSAMGGNNVLDGGTGSNYLVGGGGQDQFFVDDRSPAQSIWSTLVGFHPGDTAVVWGVSLADFNISKLNDQGAVNAKGLTFSITAAGHPEADLTLAGYSTADLDSGRLSVSFGHTADLPGLMGSDFMRIT